MKMNQKLKKNLLLPFAFILMAIASNAQLTVTLTPSNVNCEGLRTGQITANVTGGVPPYQYKWSNNEATQSISNLHGGYYHCYIVDASGTMAEKEITLTEPEEFRIVQFDATIYSNNYNTSCYNCNDGAIIVAVAGGTPPYTYTWSDGSNLQNRTNLVAKDYQLVVTDAFGCQVRELNKELSRPEREDWTAGGNANATSASFLGTTNQMPLQFKAGNNLGFTLMPNTDALFNGKIGIGTTTPTEKFEVAGGNAKFGANTTTIGQSTVGSLKVPSLANSSSTIKLGGFDASGNLMAHDLEAIRKEMFRSICDVESSTDGSVNNMPIIAPKAIITPNNTTYFNVLGTCSRLFVGEDVNLLTNVQNLPYFKVNGSSHFTEAIGIGTAPMTGFALAVDGTIRAREVNVTTTGWPDFVFDKNYKLNTLEDVEKYINVNKHLPFIPSAADVEKNGVNMADMQKMMLQQIEELTLQVIELNKKIIELQSTK